MKLLKHPRPVCGYLTKTIKIVMAGCIFLLPAQFRQHDQSSQLVTTTTADSRKEGKRALRPEQNNFKIV